MLARSTRSGKSRHPSLVLHLTENISRLSLSTKMTDADF